MFQVDFEWHKLLLACLTCRLLLRCCRFLRRCRYLPSASLVSLLVPTVRMSTASAARRVRLSVCVCMACLLACLHDETTLPSMLLSPAFLSDPQTYTRMPCRLTNCFLSIFEKKPPSIRASLIGLTDRQTDRQTDRHAYKQISYVHWNSQSASQPASYIGIGWPSRERSSVSMYTNERTDRQTGRWMEERTWQRDIPNVIPNSRLLWITSFPIYTE